MFDHCIIREQVTLASPQCTGIYILLLIVNTNTVSKELEIFNDLLLSFPIAKTLIKYLQLHVYYRYFMLRLCVYMFIRVWLNEYFIVFQVVCKCTDKKSKLMYSNMVRLHYPNPSGQDIQNKHSY